MMVNQEIDMSQLPTKEDIVIAHERIKPYIHKTPVLTCRTINELIGSEIYFKCENFQKVGAFKFRGAANAVLSLPKDLLIKGVSTHSSGNHAAALALAAKLNNIPAYIVMPENAPEIKKKAVAGYGAKITFCESTQEARENTLSEIVEQTGATFIPPYDSYKIIEGQATSAKELIEDTDHLDIIVAPVGGGGLLSGTLLAANYFSNNTEVIGGEPKNADDAYRSWIDGVIHPSIKPDTIADGLRTSLCSRTFYVINKYVSEIITVEENEIINAMRLIWERMKIIIEPSSAVPLATIIKHKKKFSGKKIGLIISGGNVDLEKLPWNN